MENLQTVGHTAIFNANITVDLDDHATQKQMKQLQEFFSTTKDTLTDFPLFICQVIMKYNDLREELNINSENQFPEVKKKVADGPESKVKLSLDTAPLDEAITKADALIAKLKTAQLLINYLNK